MCDKHSSLHRCRQEKAYDETKLAWTGLQASAMRRQALLDCLATIRGKVAVSWARSSALQALELMPKHRGKFCRCQEAQVLELVTAAKASRSSVIRVCGWSLHSSQCV